MYYDIPEVGEQVEASSKRRGVTGAVTKTFTSGGGGCIGSNVCVRSTVIIAQHLYYVFHH
jgi:hypothetical protein